MDILKEMDNINGWNIFIIGQWTVITKGGTEPNKHGSCKKSMKQTEVLTGLASDYRLREYGTVYIGIEVGLPTVAKHCW